VTGDLPFSCTVVRHRGARRMTLRVSGSGVRLTVPRRTSASRIDRFLRDSAGWVEERRAALPLPPLPLADGDRLALLDGELRLRVRDAGRPGARREGGSLLVRPGPDGGLDRPVERWYRAEAARVLGGRARARATALGATASAVSVRDPRARWGSCTAAGRLSFSWRLVLAPERVLDHVVAHEVCHLLRADHSPAFWELLDRVDPGGAEARRWLAAHGGLLHRGPGWRWDPLAVAEDPAPLIPAAGRP
jgi:predicted metal-dependent hydrolase